ncbi:PTS system mannose/fructose/N-acetylgalactosamine-transporter subunit IIB [Clostridium chrysemydis]|uniref:PTS system mannose/fructose/N-acetylgalactosamine-transporter subunit IIB n=1 Tax=Clostridium chrysemydis TaxID=2665504 RepID=UPI00188351B3|nr:PTS sugar transporter subunit IIB [Clostridium chrysemydis]
MKGIIHIRIDDRLIHGQVAAFWCNTLKATRIMVINDKVSNDEMQKSVLRMVAPASIRTSIISKETAFKNIQAGKYEGQRVLVVVKNPEDLLDLINMGLDIKEFNVGNMASKNDTTQIKRSVNVTEENVKTFRELAKLGVQMTSIMVPDDPKTNIIDFIDKAGL